MDLASLKPGEAGKVKEIRGPKRIRERLLSMGLTPGTILKVEKLAPLGDPIDVKVMGFSLSLRREEARLVEVEVIS